MASVYDVKEHTISASHIREYARATQTSQDEELYLHVKQYTPKDNPTPQHGDITIIGAHANGFPKVRCKHRLQINNHELTRLTGTV
jgi:hypothetical protein